MRKMEDEEKMGMREKFIAVAAAEVGYKEGNGNRNKYGAWYGMNNQPWCAIFVSWCAEQVDIIGSLIPKFAYVPYMVDYFKKKGRFYGREYTPKPGDIIFYGKSSHVGIVEKVENGQVYAIEGNTSANGNSTNGDGVYRRCRRLNDGFIMGYGAPNFEEDQEDEKMKPRNLDIVRKTKNASELVSVKAVNVNDENYVRLRDVSKLVNVLVDYDKEVGLPTVTTPDKDILSDVVLIKKIVSGWLE